VNAEQIANDIKAAILELAEGHSYPDLLEAVDSLAALAATHAPAVPVQPLHSVDDTTHE